MQAPPVAWPLPAPLQWSDGDAPPAMALVEISLLDGQRLRGSLVQQEPLGSQPTLALLFMGQPVTLPLSGIRSVAAQVALGPRDPAAPAQSDRPHVEHEEMLMFRVVFADGHAMDGETLGYLNQKPGGLYLYLHLQGAQFQALWVPRHALKHVHLERSRGAGHPAPEAPAADMAALLGELEQGRHKPMQTLAHAMLELRQLEQATYFALQSDNAKLRSHIDACLANASLTLFDMEHARARMLKTPEVDAEHFAVEPQALARLHWDICAKHTVVPLGMISGLLYAASAQPLHRELQDRLGVIAGCGVVLVWAPKAQIDSRLARELQTPTPAPANPDKHKPAPGTVVDLNALDMQALMASAQNEIQLQGVQPQSYAVDEHSSVVLLVKRLITDAYRQKASDIHIETNPDDQLSRVRFRKDGDLEEYLQLPADLRAALVSRIKVMGKLDISERRRPQDGKINFADFSDIKLELRVAVLPTHDNLEDVVMRLLASSKPIPLGQLGFSARDETVVQKMARRPYGLILACGPTGSGKTTTLHSLLSQINTDSRKIWTAEDPIEITQAGLRQLQVNPKIGVTFASAMRAFLRADPDVIMIGEVRDEETARISIEASLTGHLVLSTLHTNNAAESVVRLLDLGMDPMNFGDSLIGIVAQRLIRALCAHCKAATPLDDTLFTQLAKEYVESTNLEPEQGRVRLLEAAQAETPQAVSLYRAVGCGACGGKGYKGRMGIYEILENGAELKQLIHSRAPTSHIFEQAIASGTHALKQDALEKVFAGKVDLEQARSIYD